ncbi:MAG: hypothetical protein ACR2NZ_06665, partial [Rubripirellula sp.]
MLTGDNLPHASHRSLLDHSSDEAAVQPSTILGDDNFSAGGPGSSVIPTMGVEEISVEEEADRLAQALSLKFEELTLIHQLTERLKLNENSGHICQSLLEELEPCINASTIAIDLHADDDYDCEGLFLSVGMPCQGKWLRGVADEAIQATESLAQPSQVGKSITILNHP